MYIRYTYIYMYTCIYMHAYITARATPPPDFPAKIA